MLAMRDCPAGTVAHSDDVEVKIESPLTKSTSGKVNDFPVVVSVKIGALAQPMTACRFDATAHTAVLVVYVFFRRFVDCGAGCGCSGKGGGG